MYLQRLIWLIIVFFCLSAPDAIAQNIALSPQSYNNQPSDVDYLPTISRPNFQLRLFGNMDSIWQERGARKGDSRNVTSEGETILDANLSNSFVIERQNSRKNFAYEFILAYPERYLRPRLFPGLFIIPTVSLPSKSDATNGKTNFSGFISVEKQF